MLNAMSEIKFSPLVATMLLIVFSVFLGVITLKYGAHFVEGQAVEYAGGQNGNIVCPTGCTVDNYRTNTESQFKDSINKNT